MRDRCREPLADIGSFVLLDGDHLFVEAKRDEKLPELLLADQFRQGFEGVLHAAASSFRSATYSRISAA